jgi:hypothetical protein
MISQYRYSEPLSAHSAACCAVVCVRGPISDFQQSHMWVQSRPEAFSLKIKVGTDLDIQINVDLSC